MRIIKSSLAVLALVLGIAVSSFTTKTNVIGELVWFENATGFNFVDYGQPADIASDYGLSETGTNIALVGYDPARDNSETPDPFASVTFQQQEVIDAELNLDGSGQPVATRNDELYQP